ncbi:MAG: 30S ribosomal protein S9 [Candidatus Woesearchaeota archaeon]|nr:MAG: 30S ribosomal protein S9 [Candidatus Woesearchaeota archaeon]
MKQATTTTTSGKRKQAVARAKLVKGTGRVFINKMPLNVYGQEMQRMRILEPVILAGKTMEHYDVHVKSNGGGVSGQADAIRLSVALALTQAKPELKEIYLEYDRQLLVADVRRKEKRKPNTHGQARAKRQKSYR